MGFYRVMVRMEQGPTIEFIIKANTLRQALNRLFNNSPSLEDSASASISVVKLSTVTVLE